MRDLKNYENIEDPVYSFPANLAQGLESFFCYATKTELPEIQRDLNIE
jgi:hypothetical protein